jgi:hypothetical protein
LEKIKKTPTFFPPERAEMRYWHALPDPDPNVSFTKSDPLLNAIIIAESIPYWLNICVHDSWFMDYFIPVRKDIVRNLWLAVKLQQPDFREIPLDQITSISMALEDLPIFSLKDPPGVRNTDGHLRYVLESHLGRDWDTWDKPWPEQNLSRREIKRRERAAAHRAMSRSVV